MYSSAFSSSASGASSLCSQCLTRARLSRSVRSFGKSRLFHSTSMAAQLSQRHVDIVKSTAPVLQEHGVAITTHFYKRMLNNHPELRNIFNSAHQASGVQPAALAHSIWAYAANIDNLGALSTAVSRIGNKHASLGVTADQYDVVGKNLLPSLREVLGPAITPEIEEAWTAAYKQLAEIFINFESNLYEEARNTPGGWNGFRKFVVKEKVNESSEIISFHLYPVDGAELPKHKPGQFVSVRQWVPDLNCYQLRQYSLSDSPDGKHFRISVKKDIANGALHPAGRISNFLHAQVPQGTEIDVSMPYGDFTLDINASNPVVLISGGVGLTPMIAMLRAVVEQSNTRKVHFVHAVRNGRVHAMKDYLAHVVAENPQVEKTVFYEEVGDEDHQGIDYDHQGRIDLGKIKDGILLPDAGYYLCGPIPFMRAQQKGLSDLGVPSEKIHSEVFGAGA